MRGEPTNEPSAPARRQRARANSKAQPKKTAAFQTGLDRVLAEPPLQLRGRKFGLLLNQASVAADGLYSCDALSARLPGRLLALFSPQHGLWGEEQANMIESGHALYSPLELPIFSLYSETRQPTEDMLSDIDVLVVDLQDVGTRVYTFVWTLVKCMEACARCGKEIVVLDRPNPLGGLNCEGRLLDRNYRSFIGLAEIPMRHALTMGELAIWCAKALSIDVQLTVVPMQGWQRSHRFPNCGRHWMLPSPNMPTYRTACVYPGGVLLEGTNLSEGRGTTIPFEVVAAPFIDEVRLAQTLNKRNLPGVRFRATRFRPTFDKWRGQSCRGVYIEVLDEEAFSSYRTTLHILHSVHAMHADHFRWLPPPYEYETVKPPIDILSGSHELRLAIDADCDLEQLDSLAETDAEWWPSVESSLLY